MEVKHCHKPPMTGNGKSPLFTKNGDFPGGWCVYGIWQPVLATLHNQSSELGIPMAMETPMSRTLVDLDVTNPAVTSISEENSRFTGGRLLITEI